MRCMAMMEQMSFEARWVTIESSAGWATIAFGVTKEATHSMVGSATIPSMVVLVMIRSSVV